MIEVNYFLIALAVSLIGFFIIFNDTFKVFEENYSQKDKRTDQFMAMCVVAIGSLSWPIWMDLALILAICYPLMKLGERAPNPIDFLKRIKIEKAEQNNKD